MSYDPVSGRIGLSDLAVQSPSLRLTAEGQAYLMQLAQNMMAQGAGPEQAQLQARAMLSNTISREAAIMAYNQVFYVMGIFLLIASALMLLLRQPVPRAADAEPLEA